MNEGEIGVRESILDMLRAARDVPDPQRIGVAGVDVATMLTALLHGRITRSFSDFVASSITTALDESGLEEIVDSLTSTVRASETRRGMIQQREDDRISWATQEILEGCRIRGLFSLTHSRAFEEVFLSELDRFLSVLAVRLGGFDLVEGGDDTAAVVVAVPVDMDAVDRALRAELSALGSLGSGVLDDGAVPDDVHDDVAGPGDRAGSGDGSAYDGVGADGVGRESEVLPALSVTSGLRVEVTNWKSLPERYRGRRQGGRVYAVVPSGLTGGELRFGDEHYRVEALTLAADYMRMVELSRLLEPGDGSVMN